MERYASCEEYTKIDLVGFISDVQIRILDPPERDDRILDNCYLLRGVELFSSSDAKTDLNNCLLSYNHIQKWI